jgi:hypothetical protein
LTASCIADFGLALNEPAVALLKEMELVISNLQTGRWPMFGVRNDVVFRACARAVAFGIVKPTPII